MFKNRKLLIRSGLIFSVMLCIFFIVFFIQMGNNPENQNISTPEELVFYTGTEDHYYREMALEFEKLYQIPVRIIVCNEDVYIRKSITESEQSKGSIDGLIVNSSHQLQQLIQAEVVADIPIDFIPLYSTIAGFLYDSSILVNPPVSWGDFNLWIEENPGKFGFTAVNGKGGFSFLYSVLLSFWDGSSTDLQNILEWESVWQWFRANRDNILLTSSDYDSLRLFSSGKLQLVPILEHQVLEAVKTGQIPPSVKMYIPEFGSLSEHYGLAIPLNSPHRDAAVLFSQFLKSEKSVRTMNNMLSVRESRRIHDSKGMPVQAMDSGIWDRISPMLTPPEFILYKRIIETFKDKVLYF